jgi:hypothetical protein
MQKLRHSGGPTMRVDELRNRAMTAAAVARSNGFFATAEAFILIAAACCDRINDYDREQADHAATGASFGQRALVTSVAPP